MLEDRRGSRGAPSRGGAWDLNRAGLRGEARQKLVRPGSMCSGLRSPPRLNQISQEYDRAGALDWADALTAPRQPWGPRPSSENRAHGSGNEPIARKACFRR
jgi:hypothetical protein